MYYGDCVDDQHSHGKSVGKYHMVNRVMDHVGGKIALEKLSVWTWLLETQE